MNYAEGRSHRPSKEAEDLNTTVQSNYWAFKTDTWKQWKKTAGPAMESFSWKRSHRKGSGIFNFRPHESKVHQ